MDQEKLWERLVAIVMRVLMVNRSQITPTATFIGALGAQSMDFMNLHCEVQRELGIQLPHGEFLPGDEWNEKRRIASDCITVGSFHDYLKSKLSEREKPHNKRG